MNANKTYRYIMSYQDQRTKYVCLKALQTADAKEVSAQLIDIFCIFGAPCILQSYNGREFAQKVLKEVRNRWPRCVLMYGKTSENPILDKDIVGMLNQWMKENETDQWVDGLRYVQWEKNNKEDPDINNIPHCAMFNSDSILGLHSSNLPNDIVDVLEREEDIEEVLKPVIVKEEDISDDPQQLANINKMQTMQDIQDMQNMQNMQSGDECERYKVGNSSSVTSTPGYSNFFADDGNKSTCSKIESEYLLPAVPSHSIASHRRSPHTTPTLNSINMEARPSVWGKMTPSTLPTYNTTVIQNRGIGIEESGYGSESSSTAESGSAQLGGQVNVPEQVSDGLKRDISEAVVAKQLQMMNTMTKCFKTIDMIKSDSNKE